MGCLALVNARAVDGTGREPVVDATLVFEGSEVVALGARADVTVPGDATVVDVGGMTVLPGLIDGHMHVTGMPGLLDERATLEAQLEASEILRACLARGTTTVGHAGGSRENLVLRDLIDTGRLAGRARLLVSGVVTATGGHVRGEGVDGPWAVRAVARRMALEGFDFYKTTATGGFMWSHEELGRPDYTREELDALVAEARLRGRVVHCHAHAQPGIQNAVEAACDVVLHGTYADERALQAIADRPLLFMPTLTVTSEWSSTLPRPAHVTERLRAAHEPHRSAVACAHELGIALAAGTDGFPRPEALVRELAELVGCGLTPHEAILAATRDAARALGVAERLGTIAPGKVADCIVVDGDPLADVSILSDEAAILLVVKNGVVEIDRRAERGRARGSQVRPLERRADVA
jgi:imidazolonepropionase-like amidohydrolase